MKVMKPVRDMTNLKDYEVFIEDAMYFRGFNLDYIGSEELEFRLIPEEYTDLVPSIEVRVEEGEGKYEGKYYFIPTMVFPKKKIDGNDLDYYDSFEYYMDRYKDVAKICTSIFKETFTPGMYSDDDEEE